MKVGRNVPQEKMLWFTEWICSRRSCHPNESIKHWGNEKVT